MSKDDIAVVVDDNDNVIGYKKSGDVTSERIRISAIWIENSQGYVLIAQRHASKRLHPLAWGPAVVGTVEKGESYEDNAYKELFEELGVKDVQLEQFSQQLYQYRQKDGKRACMWYKLILDWPPNKFVVAENEVEQVKWVDKAWLVRDLAENPDNYVPSAQMWPKLFRLY